MNMVAIEQLTSNQQVEGSSPSAIAKKMKGYNMAKGNKKTSIGKRNVKFSSMNKSKKRSYKKYRGQG